MLCFGHPLLDMMATVTADFMEEHRVAPGSVTLASPEQLPLFSSLVDDFEGLVEYVPGGAAMNTARVVAWIQPSASVSYVGALGKDRFGDMIKASIAKAGVQPLFEECDGKPTGTCAGLVLNKDRALLANLGAAVDLSMSHMMEEVVQKAISDSYVYYAEGFFLNTVSSPDNLLSVAVHAHQYNKLFCFNLNAPYISNAYQSRIALLMPHIDILFGSDEDILAYSNCRWPTDFDLDTLEPKILPGNTREAALVLAMSRISMLPTVTPGRPRMVVVTCGSQDTFVADCDRVRSYKVPSMSMSEMVDVNGAGDSFVAGFLAQYCTYPDEALSVEVGHIAAQNCIRHNGANVSGTPPPLFGGTSANSMKEKTHRESSDVSSPPHVKSY